MQKNESQDNQHLIKQATCQTACRLSTHKRFAIDLWLHTTQNFEMDGHTPIHWRPDRSLPLALWKGKSLD